MTEREALAVLREDDPARAARAASLLWDLWSRSGRDDVDALMREGVEALQGQDVRGAEAIFSRVVALAPAFAEGWNKRATVRYLLRDFEASVADCRETLARNPSHFGALSGQGLCHLALGQHHEAAALFRRALDVYPHLTDARRNLSTALGEAAKVNGHAHR
jgi:tetratricopeptide (TPR) repeat protein